jgi:hypothetical protein
MIATKQGHGGVLAEGLRIWHILLYRKSQRGDWKFVFTIHVQDDSAGHEDFEDWAGTQEFGELWGSHDHLFEGVEQQQHAFLLQGNGQTLQNGERLSFWEEDASQVDAYGTLVDLPIDGKAFVKHMRNWLHVRILQTDAEFPSNQWYCQLIRRNVVNC